MNRVLIPARAMESHVCVAYVNRAGDENRMLFCGESIVCDGTGEELLHLGGGEELAFATLSKHSVQPQPGYNYLEDVNPALYSYTRRTGPQKSIP